MMEKIAKFLSSEGVLCMLVTFFVCSFCPIWVGLFVMVVLMGCNIYYTLVLDWYKLIGFIAGWLFTILPHLIY